MLWRIRNGNCRHESTVTFDYEYARKVGQSRGYKETVVCGDAVAVEKQHARGKLTAWERINLLLTPVLFTKST